MAKPLLSPETEKAVLSAMQSTWQIIAPDLFQALEAEGTTDIPRSHVIEVVLDAGYLETYGGATKEQIAEFRKLSNNQQDNIAKKTFTHARYS